MSIGLFSVTEMLRQPYSPLSVMNTPLSIASDFQFYITQNCTV